MKDDPDRTEEFKRETRMAQVEKLRINWDAMGEMANIERFLAAGTIQDLMDEVEAWQNAMRKAERDIAQLRAERTAAKHRPDKYWWGNESDQLARLEAVVVEEALRIAAKRGWDCFKEKP